MFSIIPQYRGVSLTSSAIATAIFSLETAKAMKFVVSFVLVGVLVMYFCFWLLQFLVLPKSIYEITIRESFSFIITLSPAAQSSPYVAKRALAPLFYGTTQDK